MLFYFNFPKGSYRSTDLPNFIDANNLKPYISKELHAVLEPIKYRNLKSACSWLSLFGTFHRGVS